MNLLKSTLSVALRAGEWTGRFLDEQGTRCGLAFLALFSIASAFLAKNTIFSSDEIFTVYLSRLSTTALADALWSGVETNPPLPFLLAHLASLLPFEPELSYRLLAMVGIVTCSLCSYAFCANRYPKSLAISALLFPLATAARQYAIQARAYGAELGAVALALLCWQRAIDTRRFLWFVGLAISLSLIAHLHFYGVFVVLVLSLAELFRWVLRRSLDWKMAFAFAVGLAAAGALAPLVRHLKQISGVYWAQPVLDALGPSYIWLIGDAWIILAILPLVLIWTRQPSVNPAVTVDAPGLKAHELVAALLLTFLPVIALAVSILTKGVYTDRYVLPAVLGFSMMLVWLLGYAPSLAGRAAVAGLLALIVVGSYGRQVPRVSHLGKSRQIENILKIPIPESLALVISDMTTFIPATYYIPELRANTFFVASPQDSLRINGTDTLDRNIFALRPFVNLNIVTKPDFFTTHSKFLLHWVENPHWQLRTLHEMDATVGLCDDRAPASYLFAVALKPGESLEGMCAVAAQKVK